MSAATNPVTAYTALVRAQAMSETIRGLAELMQAETEVINPYLVLEAIIACTFSIDVLVDPVVDAGRPA